MNISAIHRVQILHYCQNQVIVNQCLFWKPFQEECFALEAQEILLNFVINFSLYGKFLLVNGMFWLQVKCFHRHWKSLLVTLVHLLYDMCRSSWSSRA